MGQVSLLRKYIENEFVGVFIYVHTRMQVIQKLGLFLYHQARAGIV